MDVSSKEMDVSSKEEVAAGYNLQSETYDEIESEAFYINQYEIYSHHLNNRIDYLKEKRVLDVGCGTGIQTLFVSHYVKDVVGIDISERLLKKAKEKTKGVKNITIKKADAVHLPFDNGEFDAIIAYGETYSHIQEYEKAFEEASRVLKKEGIFIFSILNKWNLRTLFFLKELRDALKTRDGHVRIWKCSYSEKDMVTLKLKTFTKNEIRRILSKNKFEIIDVTGIHIFSLLVPLEFQYGKVNNWGKLFIYLGKADKLINRISPFNHFSYTKIITAIKR